MKHLTLVTGLALVAVTACSKGDSSSSATSGGAVATDTAAANAATSAVKVSDVTLGRHVGADKKVSDATDTFAPKDEVYASVHTTGSGDGKITARWQFQDGQVVDERTETIAAKGDDFTEFHISKPTGWPLGKYTLHVLVNGNEVQTKDFTVK
jgi:hypothetical protein